MVENVVSLHEDNPTQNPKPYTFKTYHKSYEMYTPNPLQLLIPIVANLPWSQAITNYELGS